MFGLMFPSPVNDFLVIFFGIFIAGIPFILIGALLSALVEIALSPEKIVSLLPKQRFLKFFSVALLGLVLPVCECGNVPLARRMILKDMAPSLALTFLLAAPVLNPLVIISTLVAFPQEPMFVVWRVLASLGIALIVGMLFTYIPSSQLLVKKLQNHKDHVHGDSCCHEGGHTSIKASRWSRFWMVTRKEFLEMCGIFLFGALLASSIQLFLPQDFANQVVSSEWLAILVMMLLAFIVSICSNVDAFFALSYAQVFPMSSILAFLVLGPMLDIKAIPMLKSIFRWKPLLIIIALVSSLSFLVSMLYFLFS